VRKEGGAHLGGTREEEKRTSMTDHEDRGTNLMNKQDSDRPEGEGTGMRRQEREAR